MKKLVLLLAGIGLLLYLIVFKLDIQNFASTISQRLSWGFYIMISTGIVLQLALRALRFKFLHGSIAGTPISVKDAFMLTSSSFFVALATPSKIGDISRGFYARKNRVEVTAISIIEYLLDTLIVVLIPALAVSLLYREFAASVVLLYGLLSAGLVSLYFLKKYFPRRFMASRSVRLKRLFEKFDMVQAVMKKGLSAKLALLHGFLVTCLVHSVYFIVFYIIMQKLGSGMAFLESVLAAGTGIFLGTLSFIPMGLGARDASIYGILISLGTEADIAMSAVMVMRSLSVPLLLVSGSCYFVTIGKRIKP